jgi:dipeptidase E
MKLFLSSLRIPSSEEMIELFGNKSSLSVAIIPNAGDVYPKEIREVELSDTKKKFKDLGFSVNVADIVVGNQDFAINHIKQSDFIWLTGGNTFYLNYVLRKSGIDTILKESIDKSTVYGGASAGAVIAGPTLYGIEHMDDKSKAPQVIWEGLGFVEFGVIPHWDNEKYESELNAVEQSMHPHVIDTIRLNDDQALTYIDGKWKVR